MEKMDLIAKKYLFSRPKDSHKGDYGRVLVVAGSEGMTGAASLTALAALRGGAGLVTLATPRELNPIYEVKLTEIMTLPLQEAEKKDRSLFGHLGLRHLDELVAFSQKQDVVAIGPGLGLREETVQLVQEFCRSTKVPLVIDADGLNALSQKNDLFAGMPQSTILTPHLGEFSRMLPTSIDFFAYNWDDKKRVLIEFAVKNRLIVILKGFPTLVVDSSGQLYLNETGNPGMATAGSGDVLTGLIASFMGQQMPAFDAACLGVFFHGLCGDLAAKDITENALIASDLINYFPQAFKSLQQNILDSEIKPIGDGN